MEIDLDEINEALNHANSVQKRRYPRKIKPVKKQKYIQKKDSQYHVSEAFEKLKKVADLRRAHENIANLENSKSSRDRVQAIDLSMIKIIELLDSTLDGKEIKVLEPPAMVIAKLLVKISR